MTPEAQQEMRALVETYYDLQDLRMATANRIRKAGEHGLTEARVDELSAWTKERMERQEDELKTMVLSLLRHEPLWTDWLKEVRGVGPCIAGGTMAWLGDCSRFLNVSKLWAYCGMHVVEGAAPRRERGQRANWNDKARVLVWKFGKSILMGAGEGIRWRAYSEAGVPCGHAHRDEEGALRCAQKRWGGGSVASYDHEPGGYRRMYDTEKVRLRSLHPEPIPWDPPRRRRPTHEERTRIEAGEDVALGDVLRYSDGHIDAMARRKVGKVFLSHYWEMARMQAGLPTDSIYILAHPDEEGRVHETRIPVVTK